MGILMSRRARRTRTLSFLALAHNQQINITRDLSVNSGGRTKKNHPTRTGNLYDPPNRCLNFVWCYVPHFMHCPTIVDGSHLLRKRNTARIQENIERRGRDSNPRDPFRRSTRFPGACAQPLRDLSSYFNFKVRVHNDVDATCLSNRRASWSLKKLTLSAL